MAGLKWPSGAQDIFASSATQNHPLGARGEDIFGRKYRYALAGAADLVVGNCLQTPAQLTTHQDLTPSAAAIGDKTLTMTAGAAAAAANDYAGGIASIDTTPGLGYSYPIKGHDAWTAGAVSGGVVLTLADGWAVVVALTAANSRVSLYANPYSRVIQTPITTLTNGVVGVCQFIITASQYGWIGVEGLFGTLMNSGTAAAVGTLVACPSGAAGACTGASGVKQNIGVIQDTLQDGKVEGVNWIL